MTFELGNNSPCRGIHGMQPSFFRMQLPEIRVGKANLTVMHPVGQNWVGQPPMENHYLRISGRYGQNMTGLKVKTSVQNPSKVVLSVRCQLTPAP